MRYVYNSLYWKLSDSNKRKMYRVFVKCVICPCYPSNKEERLSMRAAVLEENVKSCELECKASRETVQRLMAELDQEKKKTASSAAALDSLKEVEMLFSMCFRVTFTLKVAPFCLDFALFSSLFTK